MYNFAAVPVSDVIKPFKWKAAITSLTVNNKRRDCHSIYWTISPSNATSTSLH
jgi:hypothetical protein